MKNQPKEKAPGTEYRGNQPQASRALPQWDHAGCASSSIYDLFKVYMKCLEESLWETRYLRFHLGAGAIGSLSMVCKSQPFPDSQKERRFLP